MIALRMIMGQVLLDRIIEGAFTQYDYLTEGLLLDGAHESFAEGVAKVLIIVQMGRPNSYRLINSPTTRSCMRSVFEKQIVRRTSRLIRVRRLICLLSIFCVCSLPTFETPSTR